MYGPTYSLQSTDVISLSLDECTSFTHVSWRHRLALFWVMHLVICHLFVTSQIRDGIYIVTSPYMCCNNPVWIKQSHKSRKALDKHPTLHDFVTEMCTHVHICVTKPCIMGYWTGVCEMDLLRWVHWGLLHVFDKSTCHIYRVYCRDLLPLVNAA